MKRLHFIILCLSLIILFMNTSCLRKKEKRIEVQWENSLLLPGCAGMPENVGLAGAYSGIVEGKLLVLGGANFPDKYPWEGGTKTWWSTLYSYDLQTGKWTVYDDFLDRPLAYGVSISLPEGLLCIGGCDRTQCSDNVFLIKKEEDSFVIDSVSYPSLPVPLANATGAMGDNCIYIAGGQETMVNEQSTHHFYMLDLMHKERGWQEMPDWNGPSLSYAVGVAQGERFYLFSGRSYAPDEAMVEHTEGYVFEPGVGKWSKMIGSFPVMAGTGIPYGEDKILLFGGVEEILPTSSEHPGFSRKLRVVSTSTNSLVDSLECPYHIPVTTNVVSVGNQVFIVSGEVQPGIRTPFILKGDF
jgi:N-acetylneuraminate epimerase